MGRASRNKRERREQLADRHRKSLRRIQLAGTRGCLFCRRTDGGVRTQEHIFPESMGNDELVIPPGVVCDRCNNRTLSILDQVICEFMPVKLRRTMLGIHSKAGKIPTTNVTTGSIKNLGPGSLSLESSTKSPMLRELERHGEAVKLELKFSGGRRMTANYGSELSRALLKATLECAWIDHGEVMFEPRFDSHPRCRDGGAARRFPGNGEVWQS